MSKKILTIALTCFFCFLLITNYVVADKPEWAGKPKEVAKQQVEREVEREAGKVEREKERELRKAEQEERKAEHEAERDTRKAERKAEREIK